jgi:hypothetical protein
MFRKGLWIAAVVVIVSNTYTLGSAWVNRRGEPEAVLELTERELRLAPREADNTAIVLQVEWNDLAQRRQGPGNRAPDWFDAAKLASIGFDCRFPLTDENAKIYRGTPPRATYAVFENDGEAWRRYWDGLTADAEREAASRRPRLVLIDVGNDAAALRARYPDRRRVVIVPAMAGLVFVQDDARKPVLRGRINIVYPPELNVPRELRPVIDSLPSRTVSAVERSAGQLDPAGEPRYRVTVKWGRSLEPWIESVQAIDARR